MRRAVLQIDSESTWRGGENQLRLLLENAPGSDWQWHLAAPPASEAIKRLATCAQPVALSMRGLQILPAARALARYCDEHGISLVDCQSSRAHNLGLLLKLLRPQLKLVIHRRVDYAPGASWINRWKYLSPRVDLYICISSAIASVLQTYGVPGEKLRVVRSAVDPKPFQAVDRSAARASLRKTWELDEQIPIIANVAYLTEQKDHACLIRALALLQSRGRRFFCFIAGDGPLAAAHQRLAAELGLGPQVLRFLGVRDDVPTLLAASDIFALSSQDEGLGTSLLDAIYSGCALVATRVGGIPEVVIDEDTGLLARAGDVSAFAAQLERLLDDAPLRTRLQLRAQQHADAQFSLAAMVRGNLEVYRELLDKRQK